MRTIIRHWFLYILALFLMAKFTSIVTISNTSVLLMAATALFLLNTIGKPFLKILWLPINIITLGLFSWVLNIIVILIVSFFIPGFALTPLDTPSFQVGRLLIPALHLKILWTYLLFSFLLAWLVEFLWWLLVEE